MSGEVMILTASVNEYISFFTEDGEPVLRVCTLHNPVTNEQTIYYPINDGKYLVHVSNDRLTVYTVTPNRANSIGATLIHTPISEVCTDVDDLLRKIRPTQLATPSHLGVVVNKLVKQSVFSVLHVSQIKTHVTCQRPVVNLEHFYPELTATIGDPKKIRRERAIYAEVKVTEDSIEVIRFYNMVDAIESKSNVIVRVSDSSHLHYHFYCKTKDQQDKAIALGQKVARDLFLRESTKYEPTRQYIRFSNVGLTNAHKSRPKSCGDLQQTGS